MIKAVIFDVDGTLIDSVEDHAKAWVWAFARHGHNISLEELKGQIGKAADQLMPEYLTPEQMESYGKKLEEDRQMFFKDEYYQGLKAFPLVRDLFQRIIDSGKQIVLASSAKEDELEHYEELANVKDLIGKSTSADDAERSKPHPDIFHAALAKLDGVDADEVIVVGDTPWDAIASVKAGLPIIGLLCGGYDEEKLREAGCMAIYAHPADLLAQLDESPIMKSASPEKKGS